MTAGGKIALITGAGSGIGRASALALLREGYSVVLAGRRRDALERTVADAGPAGSRALAVVADVSDPVSVTGLLDTVRTTFGRLDVLFNNAGTGAPAIPLEELTLEQWRRVIDVNLTSIFVCSQAAYPAMQKAGGGKIINIGSMMSIFAAPFAPAYAASKGGVVQLTKSLATAWAKDNIQVNAVLPGWIDTALTQRARQEVSGLNSLVLMRTPAKRWGVPDDLAGVAVFLAAPASDFVTGASIPVDGGYAVQV